MSVLPQESRLPRSGVSDILKTLALSLLPSARPTCACDEHVWQRLRWVSESSPRVVRPTWRTWLLVGWSGSGSLASGTHLSHCLMRSYPNHDGALTSSGDITVRSASRTDAGPIFPPPRRPSVAAPGPDQENHALISTFSLVTVASVAYFMFRRSTARRPEMRMTKSSRGFARPAGSTSL